MGLMEAFWACVPGVKENGYWPFPMSVEERDAIVEPTLSSGIMEYRKCSRAAFTRAIMSFNDPTPSDCVSRLTDALKAQFTGDKAAGARLRSRLRQEFDPSQLPWKSKPQYLEFLKSQHRLAEGPFGEGCHP